MIKPQRQKEAYVRSVPKTGIIRHCLPSMVEDDRLDAVQRGMYSSLRSVIQEDFDGSGTLRESGRCTMRQ